MGAILLIFLEMYHQGRSYTQEDQWNHHTSLWYNLHSAALRLNEGSDQRDRLHTRFSSFRVGPTLQDIFCTTDCSDCLDIFLFRTSSILFAFHFLDANLSDTVYSRVQCPPPETNQLGTSNSNAMLT